MLPLEFPLIHTCFIFVLQCRRRFGRYQRAGNYLLDYKEKEWVQIDRKTVRNRGGQRENTSSCLICVLCFSFPEDVTAFGDKRWEVISEKEMSCNGQVMREKTQNTLTEFCYLHVSLLAVVRKRCISHCSSLATVKICRNNKEHSD